MQGYHPSGIWSRGFQPATPADISSPPQLLKSMDSLLACFGCLPLQGCICIDTYGSVLHQDGSDNRMMMNLHPSRGICDDLVHFVSLHFPLDLTRRVSGAG